MKIEEAEVGKCYGYPQIEDFMNQMDSWNDYGPEIIAQHAIVIEKDNVLYWFILDGASHQYIYKCVYIQ